MTVVVVGAGSGLHGDAETVSAPKVPLPLCIASFPFMPSAIIASRAARAVGGISQTANPAWTPQQPSHLALKPPSRS